MHFIRAAVGLAVFAGVLGASACHRHHTPAERTEWMTSKIAKHLDLDEQPPSRTNSHDAARVAQGG